uniref:Uncharacterized protein n=1 Tax=Mycena chlorophos TaxID=658473 RepID=A0ABQ0LZJ4_MYCCL|nr:predicted protein [Mycena chlorophos]
MDAIAASLALELVQKLRQIPPNQQLLEEAANRLTKRHVETGICPDAEEAGKRAEGNDLPNRRFMIENMLANKIQKFSSWPAMSPLAATSTPPGLDSSSERSAGACAPAYLPLAKAREWFAKGKADSSVAEAVQSASPSPKRARHHAENRSVASPSKLVPQPLPLGMEKLQLRRKPSDLAAEDGDGRKARLNKSPRTESGFVDLKYIEWTSRWVVSCRHISVKYIVFEPSHFINRQKIQVAHPEFQGPSKVVDLPSIVDSLDLSLRNNSARPAGAQVESMGIPGPVMRGREARPVPIDNLDRAVEGEQDVGETQIPVDYPSLLEDLGNPAERLDVRPGDKFGTGNVLHHGDEPASIGFRQGVAEEDEGWREARICGYFVSCCSILF